MEWFLIIAYILVWVIFIMVNHYKRKAEQYDTLCRMLYFIDKRIHLRRYIKDHLREALAEDETFLKKWGFGRSEMMDRVKELGKEEAEREKQEFLNDFVFHRIDNFSFHVGQGRGLIEKDRGSKKQN